IEFRHPNEMAWDFVDELYLDTPFDKQVYVNMKIADGSVIGNDCYFLYCRLGNYITAGNNNKFSELTVCGSHLKIGKHAEFGDRSVIGRESEIGNYSKFGNRTRIGEHTRIGRGSKIGNYSVIGPWSVIGPHSVIKPHSKICHDSVIGYASIIEDHVTIEEGVYLGPYVEVGPYTEVAYTTKRDRATRFSPDAIIKNTTPEGRLEFMRIIDWELRLQM
ncbi:MAG: hypothetical protein ACTSV6_07240, partial [Candidatus Heimdallarchaeota archaeon]